MTYSISKYKYQDEKQAVDELLKGFVWDDTHADNIKNKSIELINLARDKKRKSSESAGEIEAFLREYGLETEEGLALMTLAEALLRIPDARTANDLIKDKIDKADWSRSKSDDWLLKATSLGLNITKKTLNSLIAKLGEPVIRQAVRHAMKMMGKQFVLGRNIEEAIDNGARFRDKEYNISYDMLGEGARTQQDAMRYFDAYKSALVALAGRPIIEEAGLSIKLSALYPRYEFSKKEECVPVLSEKLAELCMIASEANIRITIDAEEADRLELSLEIFNNLMSNKAIKEWSKETFGLGLAVQAYQKRAIHLVKNLIKNANSMDCPIHIRLVKGAYWDTEIKHAQVLGLEDYPVFTRKENTDLSYLVCAQIMLDNRDAIYPMFGTHNAQTIASIFEFANGTYNNFEFQRLHGMGENLYAQVSSSEDIKVSLYAPVGKHDHLLAYLVRRLLENGANSSFVHKIYDEGVEVSDLATDYIKNVSEHNTKRHALIPLPKDIYGERINSRGIDLTDETTVSKLTKNLKKPSLDKCINASTSEVSNAFKTTESAFKNWKQTPAIERANSLLKCADLLEENTSKLMSLCIYEAGKTIPDAIAEIREAVDFCRYYAQVGTKDFNESGIDLPSPTGETNKLVLEGRGTFVCISPWNFPLAIFMGQVRAALMAGNCVIAKPAEQTPNIAIKAVELLYKSGIPKDVLQLVIGDGKTGAELVEHEKVAGVVFTGSTNVAKSINLTLAGKDGAIVPLIAETGGQNAMIVDSSALPEQVVDDVIASAFGSAGQRCSALRVLCLQEEIADSTIEMLKGAMDELSIGEPHELSTDIGPIIDEEAKEHLCRCVSRIKGSEIKTLQIDKSLKGNYIAPTCYEIDDLKSLKEEIFGPVLHVYRFNSEQRDQLIEEINRLGFGLTFGLHSRIDGTIKRDAQNIQAGNVYINRSTIGAVVGVQPFGGRGLSGTGPKAGGPYYLHRFATEKTITTDTTASGGNTTLISLEE